MVESHTKHHILIYADIQAYIWHTKHQQSLSFHIMLYNGTLQKCNDTSNQNSDSAIQSCRFRKSLQTLFAKDVLRKVSNETQHINKYPPSLSHLTSAKTAREMTAYMKCNGLIYNLKKVIISRVLQYSPLPHRCVGYAHVFVLMTVQSTVPVVQYRCAGLIYQIDVLHSLYSTANPNYLIKQVTNSMTLIVIPILQVWSSFL